jgi:hypothetical protein
MSGTEVKSKDSVQADCKRIEVMLTETVRDTLKKNNISIKEDGREAILKKLKPLIDDVAEARVRTAEKEDALVEGLKACLIDEARSGNMEFLKTLSEEDKKKLLTSMIRDEAGNQGIAPIRNSIEMDQYPA